MKILLFDSTIMEYLIKEDIATTNDPADNYNAIIINAQNINALAPEENKEIFIQLTGRPSDLAARRKFPDAIYFKEPDEIINQLKPLISQKQEILPVAGRSFLGVSYSNKGGVGKTTSAISLAYCLSDMGFRTALADFDFKGPNIATYFNIKRPANYLKDGKTDKAIVKISDTLYALPISSNVSTPSIKDNDLQTVCDYLQDRFECVIIDTMIAPHENQYMWDVFKRANIVYAITNQAKITMEETSMYAPSLLMMGVEPRNIRILVNQYSAKQVSVKQVVKAFNQHLKIKSDIPRLAGVFPQNWDDQLKALSQGRYLNKEEWRKVCAEIPKYLAEEHEKDPPKTSFWKKHRPF